MRPQRARNAFPTTLALVVALAAGCGLRVIEPTAGSSTDQAAKVTVMVAASTAVAAAEPTATLVLPTPEVPAVPTTPAAPTATPVLAAMEAEEWSTSSPNGQWTAGGLAALPRAGASEYYTRLIVQRVDGSQTWTPVDTWGPMGLGYTIPAPVQWSRDGRAFYFTNRPHPDGCALLVNGSDLLRLDLDTGHVTALLPDVGLSLALSPDETKVAYVGYGDSGLIVHDLTTGDEQTLPFDLGPDPAQAGGAQAGLPVWAPAGDRLALTVAHAPCGDPGSRAHSIVVFEVPSGVTSVPVERDVRRFVTLDWPAADRLRLADADGTVWTLNPATGEFEVR